MTDVIRMKRPTPEQAMEALANFSGLLALMDDAFNAVKDVQSNQNEVEALKKEIAALSEQLSGAKGDIDKARADFKKLKSDQEAQAAKTQDKLKADYDALYKDLADKAASLEAKVGYWQGMAKDAENTAQTTLAANQAARAEHQKNLDKMTMEAEAKAKEVEDRAAAAQKKLDDLKSRIQKMAEV